MLLRLPIGNCRHQYIVYNTFLFKHAAFEVSSCPELTTDPPVIATTTEAVPVTCPIVAPSTATMMVVKDFQVLKIALPIVLIAIAIVVAVVIAGVVLCLRVGRNRYEEIDFNNSRSQRSTIKVLDNSALYDTPR